MSNCRGSTARSQLTGPAFEHLASRSLLPFPRPQSNFFVQILGRCFRLRLHLIHDP